MQKTTEEIADCATTTSKIYRLLRRIAMSQPPSSTADYQASLPERSVKVMLVVFAVSWACVLGLGLCLGRYAERTKLPLTFRRPCGLFCFLCHRFEFASSPLVALAVTTGAWNFPSWSVNVQPPDIDTETIESPDHCPLPHTLGISTISRAIPARTLATLATSMIPPCTFTSLTGWLRNHRCDPKARQAEISDDRRPPLIFDMESSSCYPCPFQALLNLLRRNRRFESVA